MIFLLLPALTHAEVAVQAWLQCYNGPGNASDQARAAAVDGSNNVIVTGASATVKYSSGGVPLWTNLYNGGSAYALAVDSNDDVSVTGSPATIKYSSGGVPLWTNLYTGGTAYAMAVDGSNNVIVTGASSGDYATVKYSPAGLPLWTNRYNGPGNGNDRACAVAVDGSNNVIVTGYAYVRAGFPSDDYDYATIKYSSAGLPLWTNRYTKTASSDDEACALAVDGSNDVIVTGSSWNGSTDDYATIKYSSTGLPLWTNRYSYSAPGNNYDYARAVAVDTSNDVVVAGYSYDSGSVYHYATIKYSSAGLPLWTNRYSGSGNNNDILAAVAVDGSNNVIVTGWSVGSGTTNDYTTVKYSSAGMPLWTNRYNGPVNGDDRASAVAVDRSGNVIVTGYSTGSSGSYDFATIKYICVPSPVMTCFQSTNGTFQMRVDGVLQPGTLVIEASTNLSTNWAPVFTNTTPTNALFYTDPDAGSSPTRFYRAFQFP
jgi:CTP:phosphocholine cytidylyltransferase-like protein